MRQIEQQRLDTRQRKIQKAVRRVLPDLDRVSYEESVTLRVYSANDDVSIKSVIHVWDKNGSIPYSAYVYGDQTTKQCINAVLAEIEPEVKPVVMDPIPPIIHPPMSNDDVDDGLPF